MTFFCCSCDWLCWRHGPLCEHGISTLLYYIFGYKWPITEKIDWETEKKNYISVIKSGGSYKIIEEPKEELLDESENSDIISNDAINLFGDIIEID